MTSTRVLGLLASLSALTLGAGCASVEVVPVSVTTTSAQLQAPAKKEAAAADVLKRDAELTGTEHKVSLLEGRLTAKLHAAVLPKIETRATGTKGILYTTIEAKLGDDQTVHCAAYNDTLGPASLVAGDLRGEHDWSDGDELKSDANAKNTTEVSKIDVSVTSARPVLAARGLTRNEAGEMVADRKVIVTAGTTFTMICSDSTLGFDKRFHAFTNELFASLKLDPPPSVTARKTVYYRAQAEGKTVGYYELATFVEPKGVTKTFGTEATVHTTKDITGFDKTTYSLSNARGDESDLRDQLAVDSSPFLTVSAARDSKGWDVRTAAAGFDGPAKRFPAKTAFVSAFSPAWMARLQAVASKKSPSAKLQLMSAGVPATSVVVAKRQGDGSVAYTNQGAEMKATFDADGLVGWTADGKKYERMSAEGSK